VTGLDICVVLWNSFIFHIPPPADLEAWSRDGIVSWLHTIFWAPHHLVSMTCCMFAFLLGWIHEKEINRRGIVAAVLISLALSSAFGLSIYVTFAFFLVAILWVIWKVAIERTWQAASVLASGAQHQSFCCSLIYSTCRARRRARKQCLRQAAAPSFHLPFGR